MNVSTVCPRLLPDKPTTTQPIILPILNSNQYTALTKYDGWGSLIEIINKSHIQIISRVGKPLPVSSEIISTCQQLTADGHIPPNSTLWGEWMKRRPDYDGPECIILLSPIYLNGEFVGHWSHEKRIDWVNNLPIAMDNLKIKHSNQLPKECLFKPIQSNDNFTEFFEHQKDLPRSEGIVLYKNDGALLGNPIQSVINQSMMRCKYRCGDDGRTHI